MSKRLIAMVCLLGVGNMIAYAGTPVETRVPVEHVFSPKGFDSNDNAEIVISGFLPNLCHKSPRTKVIRSGKIVKVELTSLYYDASNPFCPEVVVPFVEVVKLGLLEKGNYKVVVNGGWASDSRSGLQVTEAPSEAIDDFVYAGVEYVEKTEGSRVVELKGYNPTDCYELDEVKYVDNGKDTLSVLPMMKRVREHCPMKMQPFSYEWEVPKTLSAKKILLHVRRLQGGSVNSIFPNM